MINPSLNLSVRHQLVNWARVHRLRINQLSKPKLNWPIVNLHRDRSTNLATNLYKSKLKSGLIKKTKDCSYRRFTTDIKIEGAAEVSRVDPNVHKSLLQINQPLEDFITEYRSLTWYFIPPDNYGLLDSKFLEKVKEGTLKKEPFTVNVIAKDGELESALDLVQCLVETPFYKDLEPQFSKLRSLVEEFKGERLEISFENCEVPLLNCFEEPPLLKYSTIAQPIKHSVTCNIPMAKHFSKDGVNVLATMGYSALGHLDLAGDYLFIIVKDFKSAMDLISVFNEHLAVAAFSNRLHLLIDSEDSTLGSAISHLFRNQTLIAISVFEVRISQGLEAFKLLKRSPSNASLYQYGWTHSGMLALHNAIKDKLHLKELAVAKEQRNADVLRHFICLAKKNLETRLEHSTSLLKASNETLERFASLESELTIGFEATLALLKLETDSILNRLSPRKVAYFRVPKYFGDTHRLLPEVPFYEAELALVEYHGFSRAQLKRFWDSNSAALVKLASDRPNVVAPKVYLDLPILRHEVRQMRSSLDSNFIVEALSESQDEFCLKLSAAVGGGCLLGFGIFSTIPDPYFAYSIAALAYFMLHGTIKAYATWNTRMREVESRINGLDQELASKLTLAFQSQLEAIRSPLTALINTNIKHYHEQLSVRIKAQLLAADSLDHQKEN